MMGFATIKLISTKMESVDVVANQIKTIANAINVKCKGPIHFPTRKIKYATRRTPCSDGSHTFEKWEMRFHKRLIQIDGNEQVLRQIMRIPVPDNVQIEISLS
jgi:small subunit ribosomal protein S10